MRFDIHELDKVEHDGSSEAGAALEIYQDEAIKAFLNSPEGQAYQQTNPNLDIGFWIAQLIYYGFAYIGTTLPQMKKYEIEEIVTDLFPGKITLSTSSNADDTIPELLAFWHFLKREYRLPRATHILNFLQEIEPQFGEIMNDPSRFGMAKSFATMAQRSGFDPSNDDDMNRFMHQYNANILADESEPSLGGGILFQPELPSSRPAVPKKLKQQKKKLRKMSKASRKKNKKKRK